MSSKYRDSIMDDVPVKISENFKPPRKIILPISFQHRIQPELSSDHYDFNFEEHIIKKIEEWKDLRLLAKKKRKINEESLSFQKEITTLKNKLSEIRISQTSLNNLDTDKEEIIDLSQRKYPANESQGNYDNSILTPVPISSAHPSASCNISQLSRLNISDFESDTSSPFDNMELKTLNDMEELAHVLKSTLPEDPPGPEEVTSTNSYQQINFNNLPNRTPPIDMSIQPNLIFCDKDSSNYNGYNLESSYIKSSNSQDHQKNLSKSVPDIFRQLEDELIQSKERNTPPRPSSFGSSSFEDSNPWPVIETPERSPLKLPVIKNIPKSNLSPVNSSKKSDISILPNPYEQLTFEEKRVVDHAVEMGFPKARAARGCQRFGSDKKKVVEFLLEIQALEEKGFTQDQAEKGYIDNNWNLKETLKHLELKKQFLIYGFPEEKVTSALLLHNNDSEMALEHLIT